MKFHQVNRVRNKVYIRKKKTSSPYAKIDWRKASRLFASEPQKFNNLKSTFKPNAELFLYALARLLDKGLTFIAHPTNPATVEFLLLGTGPLNWQSKQVIRRFKKQKYVTVAESEEGTVTVKITKVGLVKALSYNLNTMHVQEPATWDKKWRVVIFDVPVKHNRLRDVFRMRLVQLGLYKIQESVYVSPYPCFDEVEFLRELYGISFTVRYLLVEKIEDDRGIKRHFKLL